MIILPARRGRGPEADEGWAILSEIFLQSAESIPAMENTCHLVVKGGPDKGLEIVIPVDGARVGRSSNNDIVLNDPAMSRFHCRFFFRPKDGLWAQDLGSANQTRVNDEPLHETRVHAGDRITMGDTTLEVVSDKPAAFSQGKLFDRLPDKERNAVDAAHPAGASEKPRRSRRILFGPATLAGILVFAVIAGWVAMTVHPRTAPTPASHPPGDQAVVIRYEKVQAGADNIFRYEMELKNNELCIQIDDLKNQRHVPKNQRKRVEPEHVRRLVNYIEHAGFFNLKEEYRGRASGVWDVFDLSVTIGPKTHRVLVQNRIEPDEFRSVRETLEEFGRNELGLNALALSHDKLMELAGNAWLLGQSMYDQRHVKHENLALAIRSLMEVEWYLETVEPKPDYYAAAISLLGESRRELQEVHDHHLFLANRAIRLGDWHEAAGQLRIICEKIPHRSDERHQEARRRLVDIERRLQRR